MSVEDDHDAIIEIRENVRYLRQSHEALEKTVYGENGEGGLCNRVSALESFRTNILVLVGAVTFALNIAGNWIMQRVFGGT